MDGEQEVHQCSCGKKEDSAWTALAKLWKKREKDWQKQKRQIEKQREELRSDMKYREIAGEEWDGNVVGLATEPMDAGEDGDSTGNGSEDSAGDNARARAKQPDRGRNHKEYAKPCDLSGGSTDDVGNHGKAEPPNRISIC